MFRRRSRNLRLRPRPRRLRLRNPCPRPKRQQRQLRHIRRLLRQPLPHPLRQPLRLFSSRLHNVRSPGREHRLQRPRRLRLVHPHLVHRRLLHRRRVRQCPEPLSLPHSGLPRRQHRHDRFLRQFDLYRRRPVPDKYFRGLVLPSRVACRLQAPLPERQSGVLDPVCGPVRPSLVLRSVQWVLGRSDTAVTAQGIPVPALMPEPLDLARLPPVPTLR